LLRSPEFSAAVTVKQNLKKVSVFQEKNKSIALIIFEKVI